MRGLNLENSIFSNASKEVERFWFEHQSRQPTKVISAIERLAYFSGVVLDRGKYSGDVRAYSLDLLKEIAEKQQQHLLNLLTEFKNASSELRKEMLTDLYQELTRYKSPMFLDESIYEERFVLEAYAVMARNFEQCVEYINNIEQASGKVPFQFDFVMSKTIFDCKQWTENNQWRRFEPLLEYFKFPGGPFIELLKPEREIGNDIWRLFQEAQQAHIDHTGKSKTYTLCPDIIENPPAWALFLTKVQAFGALENKAVDPVVVDSEGRLRFVESRGSYRIPGGGQCPIDLGTTLKKRAQQGFEEVLEELNGCLYQFAGDAFDSIAEENFSLKLTEVLNQDKYTKLDLQPQLLFLVEQSGFANSDKLTNLIKMVDDALAAAEEDVLTLEELRSDLQVQTYVLSEEFKQMMDRYLEESDLLVIPVNQVADARGQASQQISSALIPLNIECTPDAIIRKQYPQMRQRLSSDLAEVQHSRAATAVVTKQPDFKPMTPLEAVAQIGHIDFSHDLVALCGAWAHRLVGNVSKENVYKAVKPKCLQAGFEALERFFVSKQLNVAEGQAKESSLAQEGGTVMFTASASVGAIVGRSSAFKPK